MTEEGVNVINGKDFDERNIYKSQSLSQGQNTPRSSTPEKKDDQTPKRFLNGWSKEQERLMAEWADIASCYRWMHDQSEKIFHSKNLWINLPVIVLSTLGGTANFGLQSLFGDNEALKSYASFGIGGISLFAGLLTTVGNYLRYAQLEESHRVASIAWGKFQRLSAVELALNPNERMDALDFLKICRAELDRLIEQAPPIPMTIVKKFEKRFGSIKELKKPEVCGALEHTPVFQSSELRLKKLASEAALMLRRKKETLRELVTPEMEKQIEEQVGKRLEVALEDRKKRLEQEIETQRIRKEEDEQLKAQLLEERKRRLETEIELERKHVEEEQQKAKIEREIMEKLMEERKKKVEQEIEYEKKKLNGTLGQEGKQHPLVDSSFESRLIMNKSGRAKSVRISAPVFSDMMYSMDNESVISQQPYSKINLNEQVQSSPSVNRNTVIIPSRAEQTYEDKDEIILVNRND